MMIGMQWPNLPREQWVDVMSHNGIDVETRRAKLARSLAAVILAAASDGSIRQPAMLELVLSVVSEAAASTSTMQGELATRRLASAVRSELGIEMPRGKWWFVDPELAGRIRFLAAYGLLTPAAAKTIDDLPAGSMSLEEFLRRPVRDDPPPVPDPVVDRDMPVNASTLPEAPSTTDGVEWDGWSPEPRFGTPRRPERECRIDAYEDIATRLGIRLQPWQRHVLSVGSEFGADGLPAYSDVTITVGRQAGKSIVTLVVILELLLREPGTEVAYVAHTERDALRLWEGSIRTLLINSGLWKSEGLRLKKSSGAVGLYVDGPGGRNVDTPLSVCHVLAGSKAAGHGMTLRTCIQDEIWAYTDARHEQALMPAMRRFDDRQMWSISTVGDHTSMYMHDRIERLRYSCMDDDTSSALFEWSAPSDADITDEDVWWRALPSIGRMVSMRSLRQDLERNPDDFRRATLNQMPSEDDDDTGVFGLDDWDAVSSSDYAIPDTPGRPVWMAIDCPPSQSHAAFAMSDGEVVSLIRYEPWIGNTGPENWVPNFLTAILCSPVDVRQIVVTSYGVRDHVEAALPQNESDKLLIADTPWMGESCARLQQDISTRTVKVTSARSPKAAIRACYAREIRERGWVYRHLDHRTDVDISPLWALTMAWHAARIGLREPQVAMPVLI